MSRRKKKTPSPANADADRAVDSAASRPNHPDQQQSNANRPSKILKVVLSIWLAFHFLATGISYFGVLEPSVTHARMEELLQFYLTPTHFTTDKRPLYLTHGLPLEQPHRLQKTSINPKADPSILDGDLLDERWVTIQPAGIAGMTQNDRDARWLSTAAMLAVNEQPSLVASLLLPRVKGLLDEDNDITALRIVRLPTHFSSSPVDPPYTARISKLDGNVALVQIVEPRLTTAARDDANE